MAMKKYLLLLLCTACLLSAHAQKEGVIKGIVQDTANSQPLNNATITVFLAKDSSLVSFSRTNNSGFFTIRNLDIGNYRLLVTHVGYLNISKQFSISAA